jgi:hypothetical protein
MHILFRMEVIIGDELVLLIILLLIITIAK